MYDTATELMRAITAGEDSFLELKEVVVDGRRLLLAGEGQAGAWLARQICAFANTDGGVLVLGVSDERQVVGIPSGHIDDLQQLVVNAARSSCEPAADHLIRLDAILLGDDRLVLKVDIRPDYFAVHAPVGRRPTVRVGNTTREVTMEYLPRLLARRGSFAPVDESPVLTAVRADLDDALLDEYGQRRFGVAFDDRQLQNIKLLASDERGQPHPTVAGLLLFGSDVTRHIDGAFVDLVAYAGSVPDADAQIDARRVTGTIVQQIEGVVDYLERSPSIPTAASKDGSGRLDRPAYSLRALQEAVVNAVVHRSYQLSGSQVRLFIFNDRIEISSPGGLPNSLTVEGLFAGAVPVRRNQVIAGFLREYTSPLTKRAYLEARGEGFLTMVRECEAVSGRPPAVRADSESVTVAIYAGPPRSP